MDYLYYILAVLCVGLVCLCFIRFAVRSQNAALLDYHKRQSRDRRAAAGKNGRATPAARRVLARQTRQIRSPWGWPGHSQLKNSPRRGLSSTLQSLTDQLIREKQVNSGSDSRRNQSIRALLEDRYGRVRQEQMPEIHYEKVKPPRLRDPSEPHDQMDNFGSREAQRVRRKLQYLKSMGDKAKAPGNGTKRMRYVALKDIRQPWGW
ncbi:hypothetical protein [Elongatibacter sediminis]|uniref:Uncharacterized protein n=1 Tax=Elongatibacter sediminis TaxID=3119006 RepID=A0AAW9RH62_9GAMM